MMIIVEAQAMATKTTTKTKAPKRNTFTKLGGATYTCDCCGRLTRHTGAQGLGSKLCPPCYELAGIENTIADSDDPAATIADYRATINDHFDVIVKRGGSLANWTDLMGKVGRES
jgi:hypothetical protein